MTPEHDKISRMDRQLSLWDILVRKRHIAAESLETTETADETKLDRILGLWDLTALGVGSTLGAGVYVLAGQVAKEQAGPSVILSFAIAAIVSLLAGMCYAEFGARVPKAGSAYAYSYVCIGEFAAYIIGWILLLEYIVGTASVCRSISLYLDSILNDTLKHTFADVAPIDIVFLGSYFDFFAFALVLIFGLTMSFGVAASTLANNFCTCMNIFILLFVIIAGSIKADFSNWSIDATYANSTDPSVSLGNGGFFPFGFTGTLKGAATCFFGFVGFDCIATTGEEVQNPRKNIPRSIILSLVIIFLCYFGVSTVLTLMVPYFNQDVNAPLPYAFEVVEWPFAMKIVAIGGLFGLLASLFGALFPLPRVIYAMAQDGLVFKSLGKISQRFRTPFNASIFASIFTAFVAGAFDLSQLVSLLSIGTLLAYSMVAISITILRYMESTEPPYQKLDTESIAAGTNAIDAYDACGNESSFKSLLMQMFNLSRSSMPTTLSTRIVGFMLTLFCFLSLGIGYIFMHEFPLLMRNELWILILLGALVSLATMTILIIIFQPQDCCYDFQMPGVPYSSAFSIFTNTYLMLQLDGPTWIRFGVWMIMGLLIYFLYGLPNTYKELKRQRNDR